MRGVSLYDVRVQGVISGHIKNKGWGRAHRHRGLICHYMRGVSLHIVCVQGVISGHIRNKGWVKEPVDIEDSSLEEHIRMRGFKIVKLETEVV